MEYPDVFDTPCVQGASSKVEKLLQKVTGKAQKTPRKKIALNPPSSTVRMVKKTSKKYQCS